MTGFWFILISLTLTTVLRASPITDPQVKNLALIGVIHVEGAKAKGQSVAVLRDRTSGKTRMLHKGDSLVGADLEVREMAPQQITLGRGPQTFVLRVETEAATLSNHVESTDVELVNDKSSSPVVELAPIADVSSEINAKPEPQAEQRRLIPDADCAGDECPGIPQVNRNKD